MVLNDILRMNIGQVFQTPPVPSADLTGQTIIITGANSGLGLEAAKHFYQLNISHLILACRDRTKGERARKEVLASRRMSTAGIVEVWNLDMSEYSSVLDFGDRMKGLSRLDTFVANAGIDTIRFERFEGHESTITVNVISTILLAMLAIPQLRETCKTQRKPSHLVFTGSALHIFAKHAYLSKPEQGQIFKSLDDEYAADMDARYNLSKLMLLLGCRQLAGEVIRTSHEGHDTVIVNYVNPGWCKSELFRTNDGGLGGRIGLRLIGKTAEEGSRALVHGAVAEEETHGKYLSECRVRPESSWVRSQDSTQVEKRVWTELLGILEAIRPGVTKL